MPQVSGLVNPLFVKGGAITAEKLNAMADICRRIQMQPGMFVNGRLTLAHGGGRAGTSTTTSSSRLIAALIVKNVPFGLRTYDAGEQAAVCTPGFAADAAVLLEWNDARTSRITQIIGESPGEPQVKGALWDGDQTFWASEEEPVLAFGFMTQYDDGTSSGSDGDLPLAFQIVNHADARMFFEHDRTKNMSFVKDADGKPYWSEDIECEEDS